MRGGLVQWREWGKEAFSEAQRDDKMILLDISAVWCHWCHVMDETSYSDPETARLINEKFVPVRVDTDRMPDVNERYNMGGWPTTAFLAPTGEVLVGATYVPPEKLRETIDNLTEFYANNRVELGERIRELKEIKLRELEESMKAATGEINSGITEFVLGQVEANFDDKHGGFGTEPKFPVADAVDLLLAANRETDEPKYLDMAEKTLQGMAGFGMYDHVMGGFFRYSVTRDWSVPHFEKMCESNASLIMSYNNAYRHTRRDTYLETVKRTLDYVDEWLWDAKGYFRGSQDADEEYYALSLEERLKRKTPYVDRTAYANFNAKMAMAYMSSWETTAEGCCMGKALGALDYVLANMMRDGGFYHFMDEDGPQRFGLLTDQVAMLRALLYAYQLTSDDKWLTGALGVTGFMNRTLWDAAAGGFFDLPHDPGALGALAFRSKPFVDNAEAAYALKTMAVITGDGSFGEKAALCIKAHLHDYQEYGYMASGYAQAAEFVAGPVNEVVIVGDDDENTAGLRKAALSCFVPGRVFKLFYHGQHDKEIEEGGYNRRGAAAYLCRGTTCSAKIEDPDELVRRLEGG